jgi:hypothetical protein
MLLFFLLLVAHALAIPFRDAVAQTGHRADTDTGASGAIKSAPETSAKKKEDFVTLDQVLALAQQSSYPLRAIQQSLDSLQADIRSRDLELSAVLTSEAAAGRDARERVSSTSGTSGDQSADDGPSTSPVGRYGLADVVLQKPFSSGTELSASAGNTVRDSGEQGREQNQAEWELRVSQSLWRNAFGRAVDLRRQGEVYELQSRRFSSLFERQAFLLDVEGAFWDLLLAHKELAIREANLSRSVALERWVRERLSRFASEEADLLQVQSLRAERALDLTAAKDRLESARNQVRQLIPGVAPLNWRVDLAALEAPRDPYTLIVPGNPALNPQDPVTLSALSTAYRAQQFSSEAERTEEGLRPVLDAYLSYGTRGINNRFDTSWTSTRGSDASAARVGVLFSLQLDDALKQERILAARLSAEAEDSRARAAMLESSVAWEELERVVANLRIQASEARALSALQWRKVQAERTRLEQGRSTTFQLTSFEVDAADSQLRLYRLLANLRKAESQARLFTLEEDRVVP